MVLPVQTIELERLDEVSGLAEDHLQGRVAKSASTAGTRARLGAHSMNTAQVRFLSSSTSTPA